MMNYRIFRPEDCSSFEVAIREVLPGLKGFLHSEAQVGRMPLMVKFFLSDAQNQSKGLQESLRDGFGDALPVSIVEQPPLDGSRVSALAISSSRPEEMLFHSFRLTEEEAAGLDSYAQTRLLFDKYLELLRSLGLELKTHCVRTWIYVRDIDSNYAGMVRARNDVFAAQGLVDHYIASTGIGGATDVRSAVVAIDTLTAPLIVESDKTYLKALSHLSPTWDYGVAFERGVLLSGGQVYISGTASIDRFGNIVHEGDVVAQAGRLLENIDALISEAGCRAVRTAENLPFGECCPHGIGNPAVHTAENLPSGECCPHGIGNPAVPYFIIYLRDISDYARIDSLMQERFPQIPRIILEARVCRPGWLVEMECELPPAQINEQ